MPHEPLLDSARQVSRCVVVWCGVLQCVTVCHGVSRCAAVCWLPHKLLVDNARLQQQYRYPPFRPRKQEEEEEEEEEGEGERGGRRI